MAQMNDHVYVFNESEPVSSTSKPGYEELDIRTQYSMQEHAARSTRDPPCHGVPDSERCKRCSSIDFEQFFAAEFEFSDNFSEWKDLPEWCKFVAPLGTWDSLTSSDCPLCQFFSRVCNWRDKTAGTEEINASSPRPPGGAFLTVASQNDLTFGIKATRDLILPTVHEASSTLRDMIYGKPLLSTWDPAAVKSWLAFCEEHHTETCARLDNVNRELVSSLKVVDCNTGTIVQLPKGEKYVALSYVWGISSKAQTTVYTIGTAIGDVPKLIIDAMEVARELRSPYLWVDRYCINQKDDNEKSCLIENMDVVYQSARLTIITASTADATEGLPGTAGTLRIPNTGLPVNERMSLTTIQSGDITFKIQFSVCETQGWTYQEGLHSRRRLVFTDSEVYFQCDSGMHCFERLHLPLHLMHEDRNSVSRFPEHLSVFRYFPLNGIGTDASDIHTRISDYSLWHLTYPSDFLDAFKAILNTFAKCTSDPAFNFWGLALIPSAGLRYSLAAGLLWSTHDNTIHELRRRWEFPSWSWLGWTTGRSPDLFYKPYQIDSLSSCHPKITGVEAHVSSSDQRPVTFEELIEEARSGVDLRRFGSAITITAWTTPFDLTCDFDDTPAWLTALVHRTWEAPVTAGDTAASGKTSNMISEILNVYAVMLVQEVRTGENFAAKGDYDEIQRRERECEEGTSGLECLIARNIQRDPNRFQRIGLVYWRVDGKCIFVGMADVMTYTGYFDPSPKVQRRFARRTLELV